MSETTTNTAAPAPTAPSTVPAFTDLTAALKAAIASADTDAMNAAMAALESYTPPAAAPSKRTPTDVKRDVSQNIIDCLSENLDKLIAGPADAPYNDAEQIVAKEKVANICGYLPNAPKLNWPANFAPRTGRGAGRQTKSDNE